MEQIRTTAPGKRGRTTNISYLYYNSIANRIVVKLIKSAAFFALVWGLQL